MSDPNAAPPVLTSEEQLSEMTIGGPELHNAPIHLAEYDPAWPAMFELEAACVRAALGDRVLQIEHCGSTSVPGLAAKPRIDIVLVVANTADEPAYVPDLEAAGYVLRIREPDWFEHRLFRRADRDINMHTFSAGCSEIDKMLGFRDWLRTHDDERELYERTKRELAARTWKYVQHYADSKSAVVEGIVARMYAAREPS